MVFEAGFALFVSWSWTWDTDKQVQRDLISPAYETMDLCAMHRDQDKAQLIIEWEHDTKRGRGRVHDVACLPVYGFTRAERY